MHSDSGIRCSVACLLFSLFLFLFGTHLPQSCNMTHRWEGWRWQRDPEETTVVARRLIASKREHQTIQFNANTTAAIQNMTSLSPHPKTPHGTRHTAHGSPHRRIMHLPLPPISPVETPTQAQTHDIHNVTRCLAHNEHETCKVRLKLHAPQDKKTKHLRLGASETRRKAYCAPFRPTKPILFPTHADLRWHVICFRVGCFFFFGKDYGAAWDDAVLRALGAGCKRRENFFPFLYSWSCLL